MPVEQQADLLGHDLAGQVGLEHLQDDEEVLVLLEVQLRSLAGVEDVLEDQRVGLETLPHLFHHCHLVQAVYVHPGGGRLTSVLSAGRRVGEFSAPGSAPRRSL